jgi:hypothetical protein
MPNNNNTTTSEKPKPRKPRSSAASARKPKDPARTAALRRGMLHTSLALMLVMSCAIGGFFVKRYVDRELTFTHAPPRVVLKNRPAWMSDFLAEQITRLARPAGAHSSFDHQMLVDVAATLRSSPWIKDIREVRRVYGQQPGDTLEIDCEYRAPVALVHWQNYYWLVDGDGVKLPEQYTAQQVPHIVLGQNHRMMIRIIDGVRNPPVASGVRWPGEDLVAGLEMVKLLFSQTWAEEIVRVDVSNYAGRVDLREAQLTLGTKYDTRIKWGRPINAKDFFVEVPTARKLEYLKQVFAEYGRVDGHQPWIDIRFEKITCPSDAVQLTSGR